MLTIGEILVGRKLSFVEVNGRQQYKPGQHSAKMFSGEDALVSYVDTSGMLCILTIKYVEDEWMPRELLIRVGEINGMGFAEVRTMPLGARLQDEVMRAIQKKDPRMKKRLSPAAGQTT